MFGKNLPSLTELAFAPSGYPWDELDACARIAELGPEALEEYSLASAPGEESELSNGRLLVVDIHDTHPVIVPAALQAARRSLEVLEGSVRDRAQTTLELLEEKYRRMEQVAGGQGTQDEAGADESITDDVSADDVSVEKVPVNEVIADGETADEMKPSEEFSANESPVNNESSELGKDIDNGNSQSEIPVEQESEDHAETGGHSVGVQEASRMVDLLAEKGSLLPAWGRRQLTGFIAGLSTDKSLEKDGHESISPVDFFTGLIESLPAFIPAQEFAPPQPKGDNSLESLGRKIARAMKHNN